MLGFTRFHRTMSRDEELTALNNNFGLIESQSAKEDDAAAEVQPGVWQDYDSTLAGWSSLTLERTRYMRVGNTVTVYLDIDGTSNSATTTLTLPFEAKYDTRGYAGTFDSSINTMGILYVTAGSNVLNSRRGFNSTVGTDFYSAWAASGTKQINGAVFVYETDEE